MWSSQQPQSTSRSPCSSFPFRQGLRALPDAGLTVSCGCYGERVGRLQTRGTNRCGRAAGPLRVRARHGLAAEHRRPTTCFLGATASDERIWCATDLDMHTRGVYFRPSRFCFRFFSTVHGISADSAAVVTFLHLRTVQNDGSPPHEACFLFGPMTSQSGGGRSLLFTHVSVPGCTAPSTRECSRQHDPSWSPCSRTVGATAANERHLGAGLSSGFAVS